MKAIRAKQKIWRLQKMANRYREESDKEYYQRKGRKRERFMQVPSDKKKPLFPDSDEEVEEPVKEEPDDGKRDKIFAKTFLQSMTNYSKFGMALIQQMGEDKILRSELQKPPLKRKSSPVNKHVSSVS